MTELINRAEALEILFPLGIPPDWNRSDWDYCVSARAIYNAFMKCSVIEWEEKPSVPIENVGLTTTALRAFRREGIQTVEQALAISRRRLLSLRGIGPKGADKIIEALEQQGYDCENLKK